MFLKFLWKFAVCNPYNPEMLPAILVFSPSGRRKQDIGTDTKFIALVHSTLAPRPEIAAARIALK